jgi:hypothetical protein
MVEGNESASGGGGSQGGGWSEGGLVESMTPDAARAEIKQIEADENFAGDGRMDYWSRQKMLRRRDALYRATYPEKVNKPYDGMEETLRKQGVTRESLENDQERFEERDGKEAEDKTIQALESYWGKSETPGKIKLAQDVVRKYIQNPKDLEFLDSSGLGNDPEVIQIFSRLGEILEGARSKMRRSKKGGADEREVTELTRRGRGR